MPDHPAARMASSFSLPSGRALLLDPAPKDAATVGIELRLGGIEGTEVKLAGLLWGEGHGDGIERARLPEDLAQSGVDQARGRPSSGKKSGHSHISPSSQGLGVLWPFHGLLVSLCRYSQWWRSVER